MCPKGLLESRNVEMRTQRDVRMWWRPRLVEALAVAVAAWVLSGCNPCPLEASECPSSCGHIRAYPYDADRDCWDRPVTLGCSSAGGASHDVICMKREELSSLHLATSGSLGRELITGSENWSECSTAETEIIFRADSCD
jgi:hypothetical protein